MRTLQSSMLHASLRGRQVRAFLLAAALALSTATLSVPVAGDSGDELATAATLSREGHHEAAARIYEQQARHLLRAWDTRLALLAAREYLQAGRIDDAARLLSKVDGPATGDDAVLLGRVTAEVAIARGDGPAAIAALDAIPRPWPAPLASELLLLEARADFLAGRTLDGIRAFEERGRVLGAADARTQNDRLLVTALQQPGASLALPADATESERGWVELARILAASASDPAAAARRAADWRTRHPNHPGSEFLPRSVPTAVATAGAAIAPSQGPAITALMLPLSGRQEAAGSAVRDGFIAATLAQGDTAPRLNVYDSAASGPVQAYQKALAGGARIVVGPLMREEVTALAASQPMPVPTLVLNGRDQSSTAPAFLFEFTLDPEFEARAVARRIAEEGRTRGIALFPRTPWGERLYGAFTDELQKTGVTLTSAQYYEPGAHDFSGPLRAALGRFGGAGDKRDGHSPPRRDPAAEAREGPQFAFIAANAATARIILPQLRFQMTYALPVYATSDAWDPGERGVTDLDGLEYPEFPWVLNGGASAPQLWEVLQHEWSGEARGRIRLYALGYDAATVAQAIASGQAHMSIDGLTGSLTLGSDGRVQRGLEWARIVGGRPQPAAATAAPPASEP